MTISATTRGLRPGVCTSTTRPGSPFDGQLIYETDTNRVAVYDTNAWVYKTPASTTGSVLQVVSTTKTDSFVSGSVAQGADTDITNLSVSITPMFATSKILVIADVSGVGAVSGNRSMFAVNLYRGSTLITIGDAAGSRSRVSRVGGSQNVETTLQNLVAVCFDSPATTSTLTYKVTAVNALTVAASATLYVNRTISDTDNSSFYRTASSITVMEIAQ